MKNLAKNGLSMSQATSISNLCNQRAAEIESQLRSINNCSKAVDYEGKTLIAQQPRPIPANVVDLVLEKARLHSTQAFLMENISEKERLLREKQREPFQSSLTAPEHPELKRAEVIPAVNDKWGWGQLTNNEVAEYLEAEAYAAHIGQFIHKGSVLDNLRKELPDIKTLEWMTTPGEKGKSYPMMVDIHHEPSQLLAIHEELAARHREYEQKVNYYKAKAKNLTTDENARISKVNADAQAEIQRENANLMNAYNVELKAYNDALLKEKHEFEAERQKAIKEIAALRIEVNPRFQEVIDEFMKKLDKDK